MKLTLKYLADHVQDERDAYLLLEELRWHGTPICSHCGSDHAYFIRPLNGISRGTGKPKADGKRTQSVRRLWKCAACRKQFSVLTGTIFHGTKIPLRTWLTVMVQMSSAKNGISGREIERMHGLTPETAWYMLQRLREAMKREPLVGLLSGTIVADETWIGGKPKNRHQQGRIRPKSGKGLAGTPKDKTLVLSLVNKTTGEVRSRVIPDVTGPTLRDALTEQVDTPTSTLHTDAAPGYREVGRKFVGGHAWVNHEDHEYVRKDGVTSNHAEGYFSQLKRSIDGTHHHVSKVHLPRYLAEFDYRYSTRKLSDSARMQRMIDQSAGRRLTYRPLTER